MVLIKNSRVIVTGGAQGLGLQFCHDLLINGAKIIAIFDIDTKVGEESMKRLNNLYGEDKVTFVPTDISNIEQFEENFKKTVNQLGGLDIMINNAGILNDAKWSLEVDTNLKGVISGTLLAIDVMGKHKGGNGGVIINIASTTAFRDIKYFPIYSATKAAIVQFTRCISNNYDEIGVEIKALCPDATETALLNETSDRFLSFLDQEIAKQFMSSHPAQKPDILSKAVIRLIQEAPNGAIWSQMRDKPLSKNIFPLLDDIVEPV